MPSSAYEMVTYKTIITDCHVCYLFQFTSVTLETKRLGIEYMMFILVKVTNTEKKLMVKYN